MNAISFDLTDFASYKEYFAAIATSNKLLGEDQFIFGEVEVGQGDAAEWKGKKLWAWPATKSTLTDFDNYLLKRQGTLWIGGAPPEKHDDEDSFYQECEALAKQIVSKMILDKSEDLISSDFSRFTFDRSEMLLGSTKFIGCELNIWFDDPTGFEYDENDWN